MDDFGQIAAITNQAGATTSYGYDAIGRLARIDYPAGDAVAWAPKTFQYSYVGPRAGSTATTGSASSTRATSSSAPTSTRCCAR